MSDIADRVVRGSFLAADGMIDVIYSGPLSEAQRVRQDAHAAVREMKARLSEEIDLTGLDEYEIERHGKAFKRVLADMAADYFVHMKEYDILIETDQETPDDPFSIRLTFKTDNKDK